MYHKPLDGIILFVVLFVVHGVLILVSLADSIGLLTLELMVENEK
jgi:hypothetical protein